MGRSTPPGPGPQQVPALYATKSPALILGLWWLQVAQWVTVFLTAAKRTPEAEYKTFNL